MAFRAASSLYCNAPEDAAGVSACVAAVAADLQGQFDDGLGDVDLLAVFFSNEFVPFAEALAEQLRAQIPAQVMIGCQGESIAGRGQEVEVEAALSVWAAKLPGVPLELIELGFERASGEILSESPSLPSLDALPEPSSLILLADPFSFPADILAEQLADRRPDCLLVGGMASGAQTPGELHLFANEKVKTNGAVGVLLQRPAAVRCVVSQGCRPIGQPMVVTKAERNLILELGGIPALKQLDTLFHSLPNHEQSLAQRGLHLGRVINEYQESFATGDFLIRNVMGIDPDSKAVAASDYFRVGQTVQFHLRDQQSADRELHELLKQAASRSEPCGGLLFTCNGRGSRMFDDEDHDAKAIDQHFPDLPIAGLFAQGELGPVGGRSFIHGFTACLALLEEHASQENPPDS